MAKKKRKVVTEQYKYKSGTIRPRGGSYQAEINQFGKRYRSTLKTVEDAESWIDATEGDLRKFGVSAAILSPAQRRDALEALQLLADKKKQITLRGAVEAYLQSAPETTTTTRSAAEVFEDFITSKRRERLTEISLSNWRKDLKFFMAEFGSRAVASISKSEIEKWLSGRWSNPETENRQIMRLKAFFKYASDPQVAGLVSNPCESINEAYADSDDQDTEEDAPIDAYRAEEVRRILSLTVSEYPDLIPAVAINLFAGLRPSEVARLDWGKVSLKDGKITVHAKKSRRRKRRLMRKVDIEEVLRAWIKPYEKKSGAVLDSAGRMRSLHEKIGKQDKKRGGYIKDGFRHTYGTMSILQNDNSMIASKQMGNSVTMIERHYCKDDISAQDKADAAEFWQLMPTAEDIAKIKAYLNPAKAKLEPITASEFFKKWLKVKARDLASKSSYAKYKGVADAVLTYLAGAGFKPMHKLPKDCVQAFEAHLQAAGKAEATIKGYEKVLHKAFADALRWGHLKEFH